MIWKSVLFYKLQSRITCHPSTFSLAKYIELEDQCDRDNNPIEHSKSIKMMRQRISSLRYPFIKLTEEDLLCQTFIHPLADMLCYAKTVGVQEDGPKLLQRGGCITI